MKYLLDTNICIYLIKKKPITVFEKFKTIEITDVYRSSITIAELNYEVEKSKYKEQNRKALNEFIIPLEIIPFDFYDSIEYGKVRVDLEKSESIIGSMDMLIASQALRNNFTLVTNNTAEFSRIKNL